VTSLLIAALLTLAPLQTTQETANIEGRVLRAGSQEPLPNAQVTLIKSSAGGTVLSDETAAALDSLQLLVSAAPPGISRAYLDSLVSSREQALGLSPGTFAQASQAANQLIVLTDAAGHFSFKDQPPGTYGIRAALEGYFGFPVEGTAYPTTTKSIIVEAQKPVPPKDIFMVKGGTIAGRVRDPNGQLASGVSVAAMRLSYSNGRPQWTASISKPTDDRGEFRIFWVAPGEYFVGVTPRAATGPQDSWARTFFPGVVEPTAAAALILKEGAEISGIEFSIQKMASTSTYSISGRATNPLALPNPTSGAVDKNANSFILSPREPGSLESVNPPTVQNALPAVARPNGEFEIRNVRPGSYELFTYYLASLVPVPPTGTTPGARPVLRDYIDRARVDIKNSDVEGIILEIQKGTEIRGKVVRQGSAVPAVPAIPMDKIKINLRPLDNMPDAFAIVVGAITVDASGSFSAPDIAAARYSLQVTGLPETAYVADIRQGETSIFDTGLIVGKASMNPLEILVDARGATIDGTVQNSEHKPAAGSMVVLVPPAGRRQNAMLYKNTQTDAKGNYSLKGVAPGEYTLYAWESVPFTAWMNSDFLARYPDRGLAVVVPQGTRLEAQLELIPDDTNRR